MKGILLIAAVVYDCQIVNRQEWEKYLKTNGNRIADGIYRLFGHYYFECYDQWFRADTMQGDDFEPLTLAKAFGREYSHKALYQINYFEFGSGLWAFHPDHVFENVITNLLTR